MYRMSDQLMKNTDLDIDQVILESRIIPVFGYIDDEKACKIVCTLKLLEKQDHNESIQLLIHGSGGDIYALLSIIDIMNKISCPIHTVCLGKAFHLSLLLLSLGDKRYATNNSYMLLEYPTQVTRNINLDQLDYEKHLNELRSTIVDLYTKKTKNKAVSIEFDLSKGKYMNVYEALEYGLIDEILE